MNWLRRARTWVGVDFNDPHDRIEAAMVRVLMLGTGAIAVVGIADIAVRQTLDAVIQPLAAAALSGAAYVMNRTGRARPRTLLVVASLFSVTYVVLSAIEGDLQRLMYRTAITVIFTSGVIMVVLGGRWVAVSRVFWLAATASVVMASQWAVAGDTSALIGDIVVDATTVCLVMAIAYTIIVEVRTAAEMGRKRYQNLVDLAPVGVAEVDFRPLVTWLAHRQVSTAEAAIAALEAGELDAGDALAQVRIGELNGHARGVLDVTDDKTSSDLWLRDVIAVEARPDLARWAVSVALGEHTGSVEIRLPDRTGGEHHSVLRWNAQSEHLSDVILTLADITEQKRAETALEDLIRSKDRFVAMVSHELRTPLTAVVGLVDELVAPDSVIDTEQERLEVLKIVAGQSRDLAHIVDDLLVAAQAAGGHLSTVSRNFDVAETVADVRASIGTPFDAQFDGYTVGHADPGRAKQVIRNLATNAIRYGHEPRRIVVRGSGEGIIVEVRDAGPAIHPGRREIMFEPYERAHDLANGNPDSVGLGLSVSRTLARQMGGDLTYDHDGTESIFRLCLPVGADVGEALPTA